MDNELIYCSAVRYNGETFKGHRCADAIEAVLNKYGDVEPAEIEQGFITNKDRFVDRTEAYHIASENNQIKYHKIDFKEGSTPILMSINLY
jgi:hypothetical protein